MREMLEITRRIFRIDLMYILVFNAFGLAINMYISIVYSPVPLALVGAFANVLISAILLAVRFVRVARITRAPEETIQ